MCVSKNTYVVKNCLQKWPILRTYLFAAAAILIFCFLQLSVTEVKLEAMEEERDILKSDQENSNAAKDELIKKAWDVRDAAVKRKNNTEIELARTRIDLMQVNSQLLEAIQQKVELSQQLGMCDFWFSSHS